MYFLPQTFFKRILDLITVHLLDSKMLAPLLSSERER